MMLSFICSHSFIHLLFHSFIFVFSFNHSCISILLIALADGALDPVLTLCAMKEAIALLALMTLSHIVEHQGNLAPLIEVRSNLLKNLPLDIPEKCEMRCMKILVSTNPYKLCLSQFLLTSVNLSRVLEMPLLIIPYVASLIIPYVPLDHPICSPPLIIQQ